MFVIAVCIWLVFVFTYAMKGQHWFEGTGDWTTRTTLNEFPNPFPSVKNYWRALQRRVENGADPTAEDEQPQELEEVV